MLDKLKLVEERYMEASERMAQPEFFSDPKAAARLLKSSGSLSRSSRPIARSAARSRSSLGCGR